MAGRLGAAVGDLSLPGLVHLAEILIAAVRAAVVVKTDGSGFSRGLIAGAELYNAFLAVERIRRPVSVDVLPAAGPVRRGDLDGQRQQAFGRVYRAQARLRRRADLWGQKAKDRAEERNGMVFRCQFNGVNDR